MEEKIDYNTLYQLQDKILPIIFDLENDFYLTGGTALHRFYYNYRYSNDLDFFSSADKIFGENIRELINSFDSHKIKFNISVQTKDFQRIIIDDFLQLDFVNDRVYRYGKSNIINGFKVDNVINILTNKLAAILNRDEEKDIFDIFSISKNEKFNWGEIVNIANKKEIIEKTFLIERFRTFPLQWLENIKMIKNININKNDITTICNDILNDANNSLYIN